MRRYKIQINGLDWLESKHPLIDHEIQPVEFSYDTGLMVIKNIKKHHYKDKIVNIQLMDLK